MADIRIKDLATTAASTASDDFVAVDGSANGTRKLNAFSPTFGGNLTVSGSGTNKFGGGSNDLIAIEPDVAGSGAYVSAKNAAASDYEPLTLIGETVTLKYRTGVNSSASGLTLTSTATTLAGNLTVSGTGGNYFEAANLNPPSLGSTGGSMKMLYQSQYGLIAGVAGAGYTWMQSGRVDGTATAYALVLQPTGGNVLVGSTTDTGQKLQVAGDAAIAASGSTIASFYRTATSPANAGWAAGADNDGGYISTLQIAKFRIFTGGTTALTLDSSQVAKFASSVAVNGTTTSQALHVNVDVYGNSKSGGMRIGNSGNNYYSDLLITTDGSANPTLKQSFATHTLSEYGYAGAGNSWKWYTNNTLALTLDSSQRCILAGALRLNNAYTAGAPTATGYVTIQDSAGNTYKVLVGT